MTPLTTVAEQLDYLAAIEDDEEYERELRRVQREACARLHPATPLFHWSPTERRAGINRRGLIVGSRHVTHGDDGEWRATYLCFGPSPSLGWALSGGMTWTPSGSWDLWETRVGDLVEPYARVESPDDPHGVYEVRTEHRVYKRNLLHIASRWKP